MTIEKTMRRRLETINKELAACDAKTKPLLAEREKIVAFLGDAAHDTNAHEMGLGPDIAKQNHDAAKSGIDGLEPEGGRIAGVRKHGDVVTGLTVEPVTVGLTVAAVASPLARKHGKGAV